MFRSTLRAALAALALAIAVPAAAQGLFRTYVSAAGSDANACTLASPCRLLPRALLAVSDGGEVWMLDSANYNASTVQVTKSVSILSVPGSLGSVVAAGGPAFNIATDGVIVSLRNLVIVPLPGAGGTSGIVMTAGARLTVTETLIARMPEVGVIATAPNSRLKILDSIIRDNIGNGVQIEGSVVADIASSKVIGNFYGVALTDAGNPSSTLLAINDSNVSGNAIGLYARSLVNGSLSRITAIRTTVTNNDYGIACASANGGASSCTVGFSMVTGNTNTGLYNEASTFRTLGNNVVVDNAVNVSGTVTVIGGT